MKRNIVIFIFLILLATSFKLKSKTTTGILNEDSRVIIEQVSDSPTDKNAHIRNFEDEIRTLENLERKAILNSDTTALYSLWSDGLVVNTPENNVQNLSDLKHAINTGVKQKAFDRVIERITVSENVAVVMGQEVEENTENLSNHRFTDVWMKEGKSWKLTARQTANSAVKK